MSFRYVVIPKTDIVNPKGDKKFYAVKSKGAVNCTMDELCDTISDRSTLTDTDVHGVLMSLIHVLIKELAKGRTIELGELGYFSLNMRSKGALTLEEYVPDMIKGVKVIFRAGQKIRTMCKTLVFERVEQMVPVSALVPPKP